VTLPKAVAELSSLDRLVEWIRGSWLRQCQTTRGRCSGFTTYRVDLAAWISAGGTAREHLPHCRLIKWSNRFTHIVTFIRLKRP